MSWALKITRFFWPTFSLAKSRSDKFSKVLKNKLTKIVQISVNISFDIGFQDLILFIGLACFIL